MAMPDKNGALDILSFAGHATERRYIYGRIHKIGLTKPELSV